MSDGLYLDNDVVLKICTYGAATRLIELCTWCKLPPAILGLARFTLRSRVEKTKVLVDVANTRANLDIALAGARLLEPTPEEVETAADFEAAASAANLSLDAGESQLVAMLLSRGGLALVTGDKRAATAVSIVLPMIRKKLVCLEQILKTMIEGDDLGPIREAVCRERASDRAVAICFQCSSRNVEVQSVVVGLESYTNALRSETGDLLVASFDDLASEVS
ncbi:hypothetical protein MesoLjLc_71820 [Mesorhizobium sp. L-8-10]|uniref:hypothetical protein n=1 Tax=Mesorhizobium sp. L-8-10 TaxID=2744523 RepID=UPI001926C990|nr:hypothetical protein [Mesorhizobium sp. L-8-10]BCH35252.1 hypothetical protein MesoLjLc_71820 [Mesorhizobium sp. L-8-10]